MFRRTLYKYKITQITRQLVWETYVGNHLGQVPCFCCEKNIITPFKFECAHIVAKAKGGSDKINNLRPSCGLCNRSMGTNNFFVFKTHLSGKLCCDQNKLTRNQIMVLNYYLDKSKGITCEEYSDNFGYWAKIISKIMKVNAKNKDNLLFNDVKCKCGYEFKYIIKNNSPEMTCSNNKQNILDIVCDHMICLIHNEEFVSETIVLKNFQEWSVSKNYFYVGF